MEERTEAIDARAARETGRPAGSEDGVRVACDAAPLADAF